MAFGLGLGPATVLNPPAHISNMQLRIRPVDEPKSGAILFNHSTATLKNIPNQTGKMKRQIHIHIGGYYASKKPAVIHTVLGSCAAVCLFDPMKRIGGMNHIFLPGKADMAHFDDAARYGINAMELLTNKMLNLGADRGKLAAKVFGGGTSFRPFPEIMGLGDKISNSRSILWKRKGLRWSAMILAAEIPGRSIFIRTVVMYS